MHGRCLYEDHDDLASKVRWALENREETRAIANDLSATVQQYDWTVVAPAYDVVLQELVRSRRVDQP